VALKVPRHVDQEDAVVIRVYMSADPDLATLVVLCDDCGARRGRDWIPTRPVTTPGIDCDDCSACQEAGGAFQAALDEERKVKP
jgi:hypothetical protein